MSLTITLGVRPLYMDMVRRNLVKVLAPLVIMARLFFEASWADLVMGKSFYFALHTIAVSPCVRCCCTVRHEASALVRLLIEPVKIKL